MKEFLITVNGKTYEVQVEETWETPSAAVVSTPKAAPIPTPAAAPKAEPIKSATSGAAGKTAVKCPMPGSIVKINVNVGDTVKVGTVLCILEAMKMENEIMSPADGVVFTINTAKGASVNSGDLLFTIN